jgi:hypothetical protein
MISTSNFYLLVRDGLHGIDVTIRDVGVRSTPDDGADDLGFDRLCKGQSVGFLLVGGQ